MDKLPSEEELDPDEVDGARTEIDPRTSLFPGSGSQQEARPQPAAVSGISGYPPSESRPPSGPLPRLRRDLVIRERHHGTTRAFEIVDPVSRRMVAMYAAEMLIARQLDGNRDLFAVIDVARQRGIGVSPVKLWKFIMMLQKGGFLEDVNDSLGRNEFSVMAVLPLAPDDLPQPPAPQRDRDDAAALARFESEQTGIDERASRRIELSPETPVDDLLGAQLSSLQLNHDEVPQPRRGPLRLIVVSVVLVALCGLLIVFGYPWVQARLFKKEVSFTEVAMVSPVDASVELSSAGYVVPQTISKVSAKVTARVARVLVKEGAMVHVGDRLVELDASDVHSAIATAQARVVTASARAGAARAGLAEARMQVERERLLVKQQLRPRASLDDLEARLHGERQAVRVAAAEVLAQRAEVTSLQVSLEQLNIVAPIDGMVISKPVEVGDLVGPTSAEILQIADLRTLVVETDVPEARLQMVRPGTPCAIVLDAFTDRRFRGVTSEIGRRVDRAKATVTVRVRFVDSMEGVLPDMAARVSFLTEAATAEAIHLPEKRVVPSEALVDRGGRKFVFRVDNGHARLTPVSIGQPVGNGFELLEGPEQGTRLVANPPADLSDGQEIGQRVD